MRPHLLKCLKSGHFNKFSSSKPDKKSGTLSRKMI